VFDFFFFFFFCILMTDIKQVKICLSDQADIQWHWKM